MIRLVVNQRGMVGYALQPDIDVEFADEDALQWRWYRRDQARRGMLCVHEGRCYTPTEQDSGCYLVVECVPSRKADDGQGTVLGR